MSDFKPIKLAFMGFENGHAYYLYRSCMNEPMFEIVACAFGPRQRFIHENRLGKKAFENVACYDDEEQMLKEHPEIEACVISSPNNMHMKQFRLCAERGIHVISMKVPTLDMNEYKEMLALQQKYGIKVHIELEMRFRAAVNRVRDLMNDGSLGEVTSFTAFNYSHFPHYWQHWMDVAEESYGKRIPIRPGESRYRGGALTDHPHIFDLVRYMTGSEFDTVYAEVAPSMRDDVETEDLLYRIGKLKNGVIVSLDPSYANREHDQTRVVGERISHNPKCVQVEFQVHGTKGSLLCDAYGSDSVERVLGDNLEYYVTGSGYPLDSNRIPFIKNFARDVRYGGDAYNPPISLKEYQNVMRVVNACYESVYTGKEVKVNYED